MATSGTSAELYDPVTDTWSPTGKLLTSHSGFTTTLLANGQVLVAGGQDGSGSPGVSAELYDPIAGTWSMTGSLTTPRYSQTATLLQNGKVLVVGGYAGSTPPGAPTNSAELYDPVLGTWSPTGSLATARANNTITLLSNDVVLIVGGYSLGTPLASAGLYW